MNPIADAERQLDKGTADDGFNLPPFPPVHNSSQFGEVRTPDEDTLGAWIFNGRVTLALEMARRWIWAKGQMGNVDRNQHRPRPCNLLGSKGAPP